MIIEPLHALLITHTPNPEQVIEIAGRTCYKSEDEITSKSSAKFVQRLIRSGHHSLIEHASATFRIICDRGMSHELVRHRLASYSQESTRYCNYFKGKTGGQITVIRPLAIKEGAIEDGYWMGAMLAAEISYFDLLKAGFNPGVARSVLPICLKTEIVITANLREWMHIFNLRLDGAAHLHIRVVMGMIYSQLMQIAPNVFRGFEKKYLDLLEDLGKRGIEI